jgi:hypothetical protein
LLNFTYEGIFEDIHTSGRFLANITYRFWKIIPTA